MCVKINALVVVAQCTVYTVHIAYICAICLFTLAGPIDFVRISKITMCQTQNLCKCSE